MLDYLGIFGEFNKRDIRYIVAGGIAVNLYGIPRMTYDIDLLLDLEDENLKRFLFLLKEWGFKPRVSVDIMDFANKEKRENWIKNKNMKAFTLVNLNWAINEIDVIIDSPVSYEDAIKDVNYIEFDNISLPIVSIDCLIKMKDKTGRSQDKADIRYLLTIKNKE